MGPSMDHYRCIECYFPVTKTTRHVDTVTFFPHTVPFPQISIDAFLRYAATDIVTILTDPPSTTTLALKSGDTVRNTLLEIATILQRTEKLPPSKILLP